MTRPGPVSLPGLNVPCRILAILCRRAEVKLCGPDIGVAGELLHLLYGRAVLQRIGDRGLAERMHADAAAADAVRIEACLACISLHHLPDRRPVQILSDERSAVPGNRPK